jgi:flavin reductase (DIM6/NTAB) family NADH-FMN oxidoreductase RutF
MHYDAIVNDHGLKHDPFKALIAPRPIGWIASVSRSGICNLAPYSFFNAVSDRPHYVMFSSKNLKDSVRNIQETGEFTCSMSTWDTRDAMSITSAPVPPGVDEFSLSSLTATASKFVKPPRVKESPAAFECRYWRTIELPDVAPDSDQGHFMVIGQVVGIYIDDAYVSNGMIDTGAMRPLARLGYMDYAVVTPETMMTINRPEMTEAGDIADGQPEAWDGAFR